MPPPFRHNDKDASGLRAYPPKILGNIALFGHLLDPLRRKDSDRCSARRIGIAGPPDEWSQNAFAGPLQRTQLGIKHSVEHESGGGQLTTRQLPVAEPARRKRSATRRAVYDYPANANKTTNSMSPHRPTDLAAADTAVSLFRRWDPRFLH